MVDDYIFLSYSRENQDFVIQLANNLRKFNVPIWIDQNDIPASADWDIEIDNALFDCVAFLIVLSPESVKSREVRAELRTALDEEKTIIPLLHKKCQIPRQLRLVQYVDFLERRPDDKEKIEEILHIFKFENIGLDKESSKNIHSIKALSDTETPREIYTDIDVEFSHSERTVFSHTDEHLYKLSIVVKNTGNQTINNFKLAFSFPNLENIQTRWNILDKAMQPERKLFVINPTDEAVSTKDAGQLVDITYQSKEVLFPEEKKDLSDAIGIEFWINRSIFMNRDEVPPIKWKIFAENMNQKQGETLLRQLINY